MTWITEHKKQLVPQRRCFVIRLWSELRWSDKRFIKTCKIFNLIITHQHQKLLSVNWLESLEVSLKNVFVFLSGWRIVRLFIHCLNKQWFIVCKIMAILNRLGSLGTCNEESRMLVQTYHYNIHKLRQKSNIVEIFLQCFYQICFWLSLSLRG